MTMVTAVKLHHYIPAGMGAGKANGAHGGLGAGVDKAHFVKRWHSRANQFGQFHLKR